ncbi:MAG: hypothetical protein ACLVCH_06960 [Roseburia inulinivorans]
MDGEWKQSRDFHPTVDLFIGAGGSFTSKSGIGKQGWRESRIPFRRRKKQ